MQDDDPCFGFYNQNWNVFYIERGKKLEPKFSTKDKNVAIQY